MRSMYSLSWLVALGLLACGGSTSRNQDQAGSGGFAGGSAGSPSTGGDTGGSALGGTAGETSGTAGSAGNDTGGSAGSAGTGGEPAAVIKPRLPEMPPTMIDNPTGTRLVQLWLGPPILALFEDGSIYSSYYIVKNDFTMDFHPARKAQFLPGVVQLDRTTLLFQDGTVRWWQSGADGNPQTLLIPGVDHAVFVTGSCALIRDGSVRCWNAPEPMYYLPETPKYPPAVMDVPPAVELESSFNSRCTLARDRAGAVTLFRPRIAGSEIITADIATLPLPSRAVRLFEGCAIPETGSPRCVCDSDEYMQTVCGNVKQYDIVTTSSERLLYASLGGDLGGSALGVSGTVYASIDLPDKTSTTVKLAPLPGIDKAVFVRSGYFFSCAVDPPHIKCWGHEALNRNVPVVLKFQ